MAERNIKARYFVRDLGEQEVERTVYDVVDGTLVPTTKTTTEHCFMAMFPQGHSIRVIGYKYLEELGLHIKPRMVDMDTGDVVNAGGDPYDFANEVAIDVTPSKRRTSTSNVTA